MEIIEEISKLLLYVIRFFSTLSVIMNIVYIINNTSDIVRYKRRIKNTVIFVVIAECIWQIKDLVLKYFM